MMKRFNWGAMGSSSTTAPSTNGSGSIKLSSQPNIDNNSRPSSSQASIPQNCQVRLRIDLFFLPTLHFIHRCLLFCKAKLYSDCALQRVNRKGEALWRSVSQSGIKLKPTPAVRSRLIDIRASRSGLTFCDQARFPPQRTLLS